MSNQNYFCGDDAPDGLKDALWGGHQHNLRYWCEQNPTSLRKAYQSIYPNHNVYRDIVMEYVLQHESREAAKDELHRHEAVMAVALRANRLAVLGIAIALVALLAAALAGFLP